MPRKKTKKTKLSPAEKKDRKRLRDRARQAKKRENPDVHDKDEPASGIVPTARWRASSRLGCPYPSCDRSTSFCVQSVLFAAWKRKARPPTTASQPVPLSVTFKGAARLSISVSSNSGTEARPVSSRERVVEPSAKW
ncbi:hypothetical protein THAOC_35482 [Thalassiosira oceanica]|uniref:Uncharacterized protein n=1 Tax=Thalassiosira oceanica TaxID=159749 RepID=K0RH06_THAOC|nr:hypothetical protein THAOC_35482 [Thalassiosira oceanica]|eukprot:EJK45882.1 hypothetical protein THAOC_35482 [Thalassiosira oceanica]